MIMVTPIGSAKKNFCHLFDSEGDLKRLHNFAIRLGTGMVFFNTSIPHYEINVGQRYMAIQYGATEADRNRLLEAWIRINNA